MKINLLEEIQKNLKKIPNYAEKEEIISYFLTRNFMHIFERIIFQDDEMSIDSIVEIVTKESGSQKNVITKITFNDEEYKLYFDTAKNNIIFYKVGGYIGFTIEIKENILINTLKTFNEEETKQEICKVNLGHKPYFEYQKTSLNNDCEENISNVHRIIPVGLKYGECDLFLHEKEPKKMFQKKKIIEVHTANKVVNLYNYLPEIFGELETLTNKDYVVRKRI